MPEERRNDIGGKILYAVINILIGMIMTATWVCARDAMAKAQASEVAMASLKEKVSTLESRVCEMGGDIKKVLIKLGVN